MSKTEVNKEAAKLQQEFINEAINLFNSALPENQRTKHSEAAERLYNQLQERGADVPEYTKVMELAQNKFGDDCADDAMGIPCSFWIETARNEGAA